MEKVRPWCGQPSDRGRLKNRNRNQLRTERLCWFKVLIHTSHMTLLTACRAFGISHQGEVLLNTVIHTASALSWLKTAENQKSTVSRSENAYLRMGRYRVLVHGQPNAVHLAWAQPVGWGNCINKTQFKFIQSYIGYYDTVYETIWCYRSIFFSAVSFPVV